LRDDAKAYPLRAKIVYILAVSRLKKLAHYLRSLPLQYSIGGGVLIVIALVVGFRIMTQSAPAPVTPPQIAHVTIASVASLSSQTGPLPVIGNVTSLNQATILAQSSGEIVTLDHQLGDTVSAGEVIASFENSSEQAAVLQAQGSYNAAKAELALASGSTAANSGLSSASAAQSAANAQTSALAALQSTYAALDDSVHTKADVLFSNPRTQVPTLLLTIPDSQLATNLVNERAQLEGVIANANTLTSATTSVDLDASISSMTSDAQTVEAFLNDLIEALNEQQPTTTFSTAEIATDQSLLSAARSEVVGAVATLTTTKSAYDTAQSGAQSAANSASSGTNNEIAAAQAAVQEALGALDSAESSLEKTIIRSPISGTIVSLPITQGDFVSSFSQVAEVSNPSALEVDTYVTPDDAQTIAVGGKTTINGNVQGVIVSIAPALDPTTGKILVKVGIVGNQNQLTDGDTVTVTLARATTPSPNETNTTAAGIVIPINALNITPEGPVVFAVSSSTLVSIPVVLGTILGDQITIVSGLTPENDIVTDARGLSNGQVVVVNPE
jgi:RND family efflux transporter MFP subunit